MTSFNPYTAHRHDFITKMDRDARIMAGDRQCQYCDDDGWIEQDNNGPIVGCPVCNPNDEDRDDYDDR